MRQGGRGMGETRSLHQFMHDCARKEIGKTPYLPREIPSQWAQGPNSQSVSARIAHSIIHASTRWPSRSILSMTVLASDANETGLPRVSGPVVRQHRFRDRGAAGGPSGCLCRFTHHAPFHTKNNLAVKLYSAPGNTLGQITHLIV
jgi:hypothetical protein